MKLFKKTSSKRIVLLLGCVIVFSIILVTVLCFKTNREIEAHKIVLAAEKNFNTVLPSFKEKIYYNDMIKAKNCLTNHTGIHWGSGDRNNFFVLEKEQKGWFFLSTTSPVIGIYTSSGYTIGIELKKQMGTWVYDNLFVLSNENKVE